jgi:hypothetical protein
MTEWFGGRAGQWNALVPLCLAMASGAWFLSASAQMSSTTPTLAPTTQGATPETVPARVTPALTSKAWRQLTPEQRQALAPLGAQWRALTTQQQNKWLAISKNFGQLSVADQVTMHSRMADWVDLSPRERNLARLNFNQLQKLPIEDKKAKWEAYQALSAEEKRQLNASTASPVNSAAPTAKPIQAHRRVETPARASASDTPKPSTIDRKTLLPLMPAVAAPAPSAPTPATPDLPESLKPATETSPS